MDVLLVNARVNELTQHASYTLPLGLAYIGAVLHEAEYDISAIDLDVTPMDDTQIIQTIEKTSPRILAISTYTPTYLNGLSIARTASPLPPVKQDGDGYP